MPNDTDLSELALLGTPALNFAFGDGSDRYHTSHDDLAHLNTGSLQHHGQQALALTRVFANGPLPRQRTGDAVFFDLPAVGLVVYSEKWAMPLALVAAALAFGVIIRSRCGATQFGRDIVMGAAATLGAVVLSAAAAYLAGLIVSRLHFILPWGGAPAWSPVYWAAVAMLSLAISIACYVAVRRRGNVFGLHAGALIIWTLISLVTAAIAPGSSYLFTWARPPRRARGTICERSWHANSKQNCHVRSGACDGCATYSTCIHDRRCLSRSHFGRRNRNSRGHRTDRVAAFALTRNDM